MHVKARVLTILIIVAACLFAPPSPVPQAAAASSARVLILNSYHQGYSWTDGEVAGIRSTISKAQPSAQVFIEYLDWRRFPTQQNRDQVKALLTSRYGAARPDVLIVTDNPALSFALDHRSGIFAGVPVVFCGINDFQPDILSGMKNMTGVAEEIDPASTIDLALRLHARATSMYVITDFTETGLAVRRTIQRVTQKFQGRAAFTFSPDMTLQELLNAVAALPRDTVILAAPFTRDRAGVFTDIPQFTEQLAAHTALPIYGIYEEGLGRGIVGGVLTSPSLEGEKAGELAVRILNGESADAIPVVTKQSTRAAFDWQKLQQYGIPASRLPAGAVVVNQPVSILDTNRDLVVITATVMLLLILGIIFLSIINFRRERAEAQVLRLATVVEQATEAIAITGPDGLITYVNPAFEHITGFSTQEVKGHSIQDLLGEAVAPPPRQGQPGASDNWKRKVICTRKDGTELDLDLTIRLVQGPSDTVENYTFVGRDITQEAALEDQLRQSQKLEGIGMLAGGVAHDFNNILTGILGYANMLEPDAVPGSTMQKGLHVIQQAAERAAELTKQLLSFARRGKRQNTTVDLNSTILEVVSLLTRTINKNIIVTERFDTDQATVLGDPGQLQQVVLNLSINGRDAMPDGGRLAFRTWRQTFSAEQLLPHPGAEPGVFVALSVSDTGTGIEKKNLRRIFEPFFTTKDEGKGTGMGLAMAYGIVKAHKGFIDVQSELGQGTAFTVCIPATDIALATMPPAEAARSGHGRILVVDDEEVVRKLAYEMLHRAGYDVATAAGLDEAVAWYQAHPHQADLVIIDMVMPGKDGQECFKALKAIDPDIRAILSTGYGLDGHAQDALDAGMVGYVQKPYHMQDLITAVADALAEDPRT
jgi:PAS domain S-box-containing protein